MPGPEVWTGHGELNVKDLSFCNVSLTYTHDGHVEPVNTQVYLPLKDAWNGRMVGIGGGGWAAGLMEISKQEMVGGVSEGYLAVGTNGGGDPFHPSPENWMLHDNGTVNAYLLELFASQALEDAANIGKAVAKSFYGSAPRYSYWQGCSQGGRQGLELAQKFPEAYDGILAVAPALNIPSFLVANYWLPFLMDRSGEYPHRCEFDAIREAAIAECDHEDGISDGIIADPSVCLSKFSPLDLIGTTIPCPTSEGKRNISRIAAIVAEAAWTGTKMHNGVPMGYASSPDADLVNQYGRARTNCVDGVCHESDPSPLTIAFLTKMVRKDINLTKITQYGYEKLYHTAKGQYDHILASNNPDLSKFRDKGGKILSIHGLADEIIPPGGTQKYYEAVLERDPNARDYFRHFDAPGLGHCPAGQGPTPTNSFADLVAWVEQGKTPETLLARGRPRSRGNVVQRPLCVYPLVARYRGTGDENDPRNFYCADEYLSATPIKLVLKRARNYWGAKPKTNDEL